MGIPIGEEPPDLGECPECCAELPSSISARLTVPGMAEFSGTLDQVEGHPCQFAGLCSDGVNGDVPVFVTFCDDGGTVRCSAGGPIGFQCGGGAVEDNHCNTPFSCTSPGECEYIIG